MTAHECWRGALLVPTKVLVQLHSPLSLRTKRGRKPAPGSSIVKCSPGRLPLWDTSPACACCTNWVATRRPA